MANSEQQQPIELQQIQFSLRGIIFGTLVVAVVLGTAAPWLRQFAVRPILCIVGAALIGCLYFWVLVFLNARRGRQAIPQAGKQLLAVRSRKHWG